MKTFKILVFIIACFGGLQVSGQRIHPDFDTSIPFAGTSPIVHTVHETPDGRVLTGGDFRGYGKTEAPLLTEITIQGEPTPFRIAAEEASGVIYDLEIDNEGLIYIAGDFTITDANNNTIENIARLFPDGRIDYDFAAQAGSEKGTDGASVRAIALSPDGSALYIGGAFDGLIYDRNFYPSPGLVRVDRSGAYDQGFNVGTGINVGQGQTILDIEVDEKQVFIGGDILSYNGSQSGRHLFRLDTEGGLVRGNFTPVFNGPVRDIEMNIDNESIIVGGEFNAINETEVDYIIKLSKELEPDPNFLFQKAFDAPVLTLDIMPERGFIAAGGQFTTHGEYERNRVILLDNDGIPVETVHPGTGPDLPVEAVIFLNTTETPELFIGGGFTSYHCRQTAQAIRLLPESPALPDINMNVELESNYCPGQEISVSYTVLDELCEINVEETRVILSNSEGGFGTGTQVIGSTLERGEVVAVIPEDLTSSENYRIRLEYITSSKETQVSTASPSFGISVEGDLGNLEISAPEALCNYDGSEVELSATSYEGFTYDWSLEGGDAEIIQGAGTASVLVTFAEDFSSSVYGYVYAGNGCTSTSNEFQIRFIEPTTATISQPSADELYLCDQSEIVLQANFGESSAQESWGWQLEDSTLLSETENHTHDISNGGSFTFVYVISREGCFSTDTVTVHNAVANAGGDYEYCSSWQEDVFLDANTVESTPFTGLWQSSGDGEVDITPSDAHNAMISPDSGIHTLTWTVENPGGQCTSTDQAMLFADPLADGGEDVETCEDTAEISANAIQNRVTAGYRYWYWESIEKGVDIAESGNATTAATFSDYGEYQLVWNVGSESCGVTDKDTVLVTYSAPVSPEVTIEASQETICAGETTHFTISQTTGAGENPIYRWYVNRNFTGETGAAFETNTLEDGDVVFAAMQSDETCATSPSANSNNVTITVLDAPQQQYSIQPTSQQEISCAGETMVYEVYDENGNAPPENVLINWSVSSGEIVPESNGATAQVTFTDKGEHVITVTPENSCGEGVSSTRAVDVEDVPGSPGIISGPDQVCDAETPQYQIDAIDNAEGYQWAVPGFEFTTDGTYMQFSASGQNDEAVISVYGINACGEGEEATKSVAINTPPQGEMSITAPEFFCQGEENILLETTDLPDATSYSWNVTGGELTSDSTLNEVQVNTGSADIAATVTAFNNCGEGTASRTVIPLSVVETPSIEGNQTPQCAESNVDYSILQSNQAMTYKWTVPEEASYEETLEGIMVDFGTRSGYVSVIATNADGCVGEEEQLAVRLQNCDFQADFITDQDQICIDGQVTFEDVSNSVGEEAVYAWQFGEGAEPATYDGSGPVEVSYTVPGTKEIQLIIDNQGISDTATKQIYVAPMPDEPVVSGPSSVCAETTGHVFTIDNFSEQVAYQWQLSTGLSTTSPTDASSITIDVNESGGEVMVEATQDGLCSRPSAAYPINITPVPETPEEIAGDTAPCVGDTIIYETSAAGASSYTWQIPEGMTALNNGEDGAVQAVIDGDGQQVIVVSAQNECGTSEGQRVLTVDPLSPPQTAPVIESELERYCPSSLASYYISAPQEELTYTWVLPAGAEGDNSGTSIDFTTGEASGILTVAASNQCGPGPEAEVMVDVIEVPAPDTLLGSRQVCPNEEGVRYYTSVFYDADYRWTVPEGASFTAEDSSVVVDFGMTSGTVGLDLSHVCAESITSSATVSVQESIVPEIAISDTMIICEGKEGSVTADYSGGGSVPEFSWYVNGNNTLDEGSMLSTTSLEDGDEVYVTMRSSSSCAEPTIATSDSMHVLYSDGPQLVLNDRRSCDEQDAITLTGYASYEWSFGGEAIGETATLQIDTSGTYTLRVTDEEGCAATDSAQFLVNPDLTPLADDTSTVYLSEVIINVLANDEVMEGDSIFVDSTSMPLHGDISINDDFTITYFPQESFSGNDYFEYTVSNACVSKTNRVDIRVRPLAGMDSSDTEGTTVTLNAADLLNSDKGRFDLNAPLSSYYSIERIASGAFYSFEEDRLILDYTEVDYNFSHDTIYYEVCDLDTLCDRSVHLLRRDVKTEEPSSSSLTVHNAISPNGDGQNDTFWIENIDQEQFQHNRVHIYNRWGDQVADIKNYHNMQNNWDGKKANGEVLSSGTYYYVIRAWAPGENSKDAETISGYVILKGEK